MISAKSDSATLDFPTALRGRPDISHVIFDFDGTLSWLRHGWPTTMQELFREYYPAQAGEDENGIREFLLSGLLALNGRQSIYQMEWFAGLVQARGGQSPTPAELLDEYQRRLDGAIRERTELILTK